jgi:hypothetical protein
MKSVITRRLSPEEEELARKRDELALLQGELADRELNLANLRVELSTFEGRQQSARWRREAEAAEAAETADRIPPVHLWQGRESMVLTLKTPRGIEKWQLVDGRPRFVVWVREEGSTV